VYSAGSKRYVFLNHNLDTIRAGSATEDRIFFVAALSSGIFLPKTWASLWSGPMDVCGAGWPKARQRTVGVCARIMVRLSAEELDNETTSIDATYLKATRAASSLWCKKGGVNA